MTETMRVVRPNGQVQLRLRLTQTASARTPPAQPSAGTSVRPRPGHPRPKTRPTAHDGEPGGLITDMTSREC